MSSILPINPIAAHVGSGVVQVYVIPPVIPANHTQFSKFEVQSALALEGPYFQFSNRFFSTKDWFIYDFPLGNTVYIQIRSVLTDGTTSDWVQARLGVLGKPTVVMELVAPTGSRIDAGSMFTARKNEDWMVGFIALTDINF